MVIYTALISELHKGDIYYSKRLLTAISIHLGKSISTYRCMQFNNDIWPYTHNRDNLIFFIGQWASVFFCLVPWQHLAYLLLAFLLCLLPTFSHPCTNEYNWTLLLLTWHIGVMLSIIKWIHIHASKNIKVKYTSNMDLIEVFSRYFKLVY